MQVLGDECPVDILLSGRKITVPSIFHSVDAERLRGRTAYIYESSFEGVSNGYWVVIYQVIPSNELRIVRLLDIPEEIRNLHLESFAECLKSPVENIKTVLELFSL
jgi:hypothetical protein